MNPRPRILVTGTTGQLGSALLATLAPFAEVVPADRRTLNLGETATIRPCVRELKPNLIVNAAAYTAVDRAEAEPQLAHAINALAPGELAGAARELGCALLHVSTDYVFDGSARTPYPPSAPTNPINVYGRTKRDGELAALQSGARCVIVRTSWVYAMQGRNFVRAILAQIEQGKPLRVVNDQFGSPTFAHDLAVGAAAIARTLLAPGDAHAGVYHLTGSGITNWHEFACAIVALTTPAPHPEVAAVPSTAFETKAKRPMYSALDCSTTERDFGVVLPHWRDAIARAIASIRSVS